MTVYVVIEEHTRSIIVFSNIAGVIELLDCKRCEYDLDELQRIEVFDSYMTPDNAYIVHREVVLLNWIDQLM